MKKKTNIYSVEKSADITEAHPYPRQLSDAIDTCAGAVDSDSAREPVRRATERFIIFN